MANCYTKQTLQTKVKQLEEATGSSLKLISSNGLYAIQYESGLAFPGAGWYQTIKWLIIYVDGLLAGVKFCQQTTRAKSMSQEQNYSIIKTKIQEN